MAPWFAKTCRFAGVLGAATALVTAAAVLHGQAQNAPEPQVLYWERDGQPGTGTAVGLLYTPDVLASLASRLRAEAVPGLIADAIQQGTAIVAMWDIPPTSDYEHKRPYHIVIVERRMPNAGAEGSIQPLWVQQEAGDLAAVDRRLTSAEVRVGAVAAFPASAFTPTRLVLVHSAPERREDGMVRRSQRWGAIRWEGTARSAGRRGR